MKIKKYLAFFSVIVITTSFFACSSDDDDTGGNVSTPTVIKKMVSFRYKSAKQDYDLTYLPFYDSQERIVEVKINNNNTGKSSKVPFTWNGNSFEYKFGSDVENYTLQDGKICKSSNSRGTTTYTYDTNGAPKIARYLNTAGDYSVNYFYTCSNNRFCKYELMSGIHIREYSYEYSSNRRGVGAHVMFCDFIVCGPKHYVFFHPEIFGMENMTELPDKWITKEEGFNITYDITYEIDKDGYVTCIRMIPPSNRYNDYTYYLEWK